LADVHELPHKPSPISSQEKSDSKKLLSSKISDTEKRCLLGFFRGIVFDFLTVEIFFSVFQLFNLAERPRLKGSQSPTRGGLNLSQIIR